MVGRRRGLSSDLAALVPVVRDLRAMGASVIKLTPDGSVTLAFDSPFLPATADVVAPSKSAAAEEREILFDSADDGA